MWIIYTIYQPLPYAEFWWVKDAANFDMSAIAPDSSIDYILEVDFEYAQHLYTTNTLTYLSVHDKSHDNRSASAKLNF